MKKLTDFINETMQVTSYFNDEYCFDAKKLANELKAYRGKMPAIEHCNVIDDNFYSIEKDMMFANAVWFETKNKRLDICAYISSEGSEEGDTIDGILYSVYLFAVNASDTEDELTGNHKHTQCVVCYDVEGEYSNFLADLCSTVNKFAEALEDVWDEYPDDDEMINNEITKFAKTARKCGTLTLRDCKPRWSMPEFNKIQIVKSF